MEIILLDKHKKKLGYLSRSGKIVQKEREDIKIGKVYNIFQDNKGIFWLSTKGNGIFTDAIYIFPRSGYFFPMREVRHIAFDTVKN